MSEDEIEGIVQVIKYRSKLGVCMTDGELRILARQVFSVLKRNYETLLKNFPIMFGRPQPTKRDLVRLVSMAWAGLVEPLHLADAFARQPIRMPRTPTTSPIPRPGPPSDGRVLSLQSFAKLLSEILALSRCLWMSCSAESLDENLWWQTCLRPTSCLVLLNSTNVSNED